MGTNKDKVPKSHAPAVNTHGGTLTGVLAMFPKVPNRIHVVRTHFPEFRCRVNFCFHIVVNFLRIPDVILTACSLSTIDMDKSKQRILSRTIAILESLVALTGKCLVNAGERPPLSVVTEAAPAPPVARDN